MDLGEGLRQAIARLSRSTIIDAPVIKAFCKDLQRALLSADVEVSLVFKLTQSIEAQSLSAKPPPGVTPKDYMVRLVYEQLVGMMGESYVPEIRPKRILLMGLYGSGKTTTAAKLARFYSDRGVSAALICCDVSRPAAYEQLSTLAAAANASFFGLKDGSGPAAIARLGRQALRDRGVIICDTGGRDAVDGRLTAEMDSVAKAFEPDERLLVISADMGQSAGRQAAQFSSAINVDGIIVTKMDSSSKGGGALSAAHAAGARVMFVCTGEKLQQIEPYDAADFIGGLLGIPNIMALVETVQRSMRDAGIKESELDADDLTYETFYAQIRAMGKMGSLRKLLGMTGITGVPDDALEQGSEKLGRYGVIIASMTPEERRNARLLHSTSRIRRIAAGSGTSEKDVRMLISDFNRMKKMVAAMKGDRSLMKRFRALT